MQRSETSMTKVVHIRITPDLDRDYERLVGTMPGRKPDIMRFALEKFIHDQTAPLRRAADARERSGSEVHESMR